MLAFNNNYFPNSKHETECSTHRYAHPGCSVRAFELQDDQGARKYVQASFLCLKDCKLGQSEAVHPRVKHSKAMQHSYVKLYMSNYVKLCSYAQPNAERQGSGTEPPKLPLPSSRSDTAFKLSTRSNKQANFVAN